MYKNLIVTISTRMANYFSLFEVALLASFIPGIRKTLENTGFSRVLWVLLKICKYQIIFPSVLQLPLQSSLLSSQYLHRSRNEQSS